MKNNFWREEKYAFLETIYRFLEVTSYTIVVTATAANDSISIRRCTSAAAAYLEYDSLAKVLLPTGSTSPGALRETIHGIVGKTMRDRIRKLDFAFHYSENTISSGKYF